MNLWMNDHERWHSHVVLFAALLYLITAWNSTGYHSADEQHQVISIALHRMGEVPQDAIPWEYDTGIRSSIQPWIAALVIQATRALGMDDPMWQAFLLRLLSASLALWALVAFIRAVLHEVPVQWRKAFLLLSYFLWFLPFLAVRYSSETWSSIALLAGLGAAIHPQRTLRWPLWTGAMCAMAVLLRPSTAIIALGLYAWLWSERKGTRGQLFQVLMAVLLIGSLGAALDSLFYGRVTFSPWNYAVMALSGPPREAFDTLPWFYYPPWIIKYAIPPIGATLLVALCLLLLRQPRHLLVRCMVPYLVMISLVPHKEVRFLYPLAFLAPWLLVTALPLVQQQLTQPLLHWPVRLWVAICVLLNMLGLAVVVTQPAGSGNTALLKAMPSDRSVTYLVSRAELWKIQPPAFYRSALPNDKVVDPHQVSGPITTDLLVATEADVAVLNELTGQSYSLQARASSLWAEALFRRYTWNEGQPPYGLYAVGSFDPR